ncbi:MAG: hypothetical protein AAF547_08535 [Actinomycetota bacterium]
MTEGERSIRLSEALSVLWERAATDYGLLPDLPGDAVLVRADQGELAAATPRLLDLAVSSGLTVTEAATAVTMLGDQAITPDAWPTMARDVEELLDAWWVETLQREPGTHADGFGPATVLGILAGYDAPMVRWLGPWLDQLDGPGAVHLAEIVVAGPAALSAEAWRGKDDQAGQLFAWARTETVVHGLALIGGIHLEDGVLDRVLDRLI